MDVRSGTKRTRATHVSTFWTNPSVLLLSKDRDPIEAISGEARDLVFRAFERGWHGPPFDPFALAELLGIQTDPRSDVLDARTVPISPSRYRIEFNPDRPRRRVRYSVFHEIAHTLFPDCAQMIRNRGVHNAGRKDDWQLETLCNIAAAEFLLPTGSLDIAREITPSVDTVLELRQRYEASAEAALLRITSLTTQSAIAFSTHRDIQGRYVIEYAIPTVAIRPTLQAGWVLPTNSAVAQCTAIGYTAKQDEQWAHIGRVRVECVGVAPAPREIYPRVIGFAVPPEDVQKAEPSIAYLRGDATQPRGTGQKLIVQVVNDAAFSWGGGFADAVRRRWPSAQKSFTSEVSNDKRVLHLGNVVSYQTEPGITLVSIIAQRGYGASPRPRIRYGALREGLLRVREIATKMNAGVHMPRIGTGQAGGSWPVVQELIREALLKAGVNVSVYDLPQGKERPKIQCDLALT